jgi:hypothetical protein
MDDHDILARISGLVEEEHRLREAPAGEQSPQRLADIEVQLDQSWDLLRQRQALRDAGGSAEAAHVRPVDEVEQYLQ